MERKTLKVKEVLPPRQITLNGEPRLDRNGKPMQSYAFTAEDGNKYETLSSTIGAYFVAGKDLDAEVETKENGQYINHYIKQVFHDGQPVSGASRGFTRSASSGRTQEDRESIESQVAVKAVTDLWIAGKVTDDSPQVKVLLAWLYTRLTSTPKPATDKPADKPAGTLTVPKATPEQLKALNDAQVKANLTNTRLAALIPAEWKITKREDLTGDQCKRVIELVNKASKPTETEELPF